MSKLNLNIYETFLKSQSSLINRMENNTEIFKNKRFSQSSFQNSKNYFNQYKKNYKSINSETQRNRRERTRLHKKNFLSSSLDFNNFDSNEEYNTSHKRNKSCYFCLSEKNPKNNKKNKIYGVDFNPYIDCLTKIFSRKNRLEKKNNNKVKNLNIDNYCINQYTSQKMPMSSSKTRSSNLYKLSENFYNNQAYNIKDDIPISQMGKINSKISNEKTKLPESSIDKAKYTNSIINNNNICDLLLNKNNEYTDLNSRNKGSIFIHSDMRVDFRLSISYIQKKNKSLYWVKTT